MRLIDADALRKEIRELPNENTDYIYLDLVDREVVQALISEAPTVKARPHGECKTCKHYVPYKEQFSYRNRGDGYCKSAITNSEGEAYINCSDEWYCANYEKEGDAK